MQRYASLPRLEQAQVRHCPEKQILFARNIHLQIIYWTLAPFTILCSAVAFIGFIALAYFYNCNPIETGQITETDHLTIIFARDVLQPTPGLFGLYISCIMSATLSTLSSGMNSMAAAVYEDFIKSSMDGRITDHQATLVNKVACLSLHFSAKFIAIVVIGGVVSTALAFSAESLGGILRVTISVMGAISGPMVAIFVLAMFFPKTGFWSCLISFIVSNIIMVAICMANYIEDPYGDLFLPTNSSITGCQSRNFTVRQLPPYDAHYGNQETMYISRFAGVHSEKVGSIL
ncbi:unnamed protein product [Cylicostephanus goldi]|uniref:Sodium/solute symporter n=1 Tax=Cylicostephanus goldi TaxID=71465 RepID=A0A3P7LWM0_CYLGO|nr:unnamed protein product [Cylicostephanus goldi]